jgi:catechol 2,3-dioxygenase-like lactoylglutathione lyase family enzyme
MKRMHLHVGVSDLDRSVAFYTALFGASPTVHHADYAKWMLDDPRVNFAISQGHCAATGIEHVGIQAETEGELVALTQQLTAADEPTRAEAESRCCYAASSKTWTRDPDGVIWETFHTMDQIHTYGTRPDFTPLTAPATLPEPATSPCCG